MKVTTEANPLLMKLMISCAPAKIGEEGLDAETFKRWENHCSEGKLSEKEIKEIEKHSEKVMQALSNIAAKQGKTEIDAEVILKYFLFGHNNALGHISDLSEAMRRFIASDVSHDCMARVCIAGRIDSNRHIVSIKTSEGEQSKKYNMCFERDLAEGDLVIAHRGYVIKIPPDALKNIGYETQFLNTGKSQTKV